MHTRWRWELSALVTAAITALMLANSVGAQAQNPVSTTSTGRGTPGITATLVGTVATGTNADGEGFQLVSLTDLSDVSSISVTAAPGTGYLAAFAADAEVTVAPAPAEATPPWNIIFTQENNTAQPDMMITQSPAVRTRFILVLARHTDNTGGPAPTSLSLTGSAAPSSATVLGTPVVAGTSRPSAEAIATGTVGVTTLPLSGNPNGGDTNLRVQFVITLGAVSLVFGIALRKRAAPHYLPRLIQSRKRIPPVE